MPQLLWFDIGGLTIRQQTVITPSYPLAFSRRSTSRATRIGSKGKAKARLSCMNEGGCKFSMILKGYYCMAADNGMHHFGLNRQ
jgi:hypothetical protein